MEGVIEVPVWVATLIGVAAAVAVLDRLVAPSFRWLLRRRLHRAVDEFNERLQLRIQPFKLIRRRELIDRLVYDPTVVQAAEDHGVETGMPRDLVMRQVREYAREITPSFSAHMYFFIGARVSRWISRMLYRVRLGAFDENGLSGVDREATVVFVMNHKSNVDYLLVTYLASTSSALSYAVGEWAQIWPLNRLIRSMGAYFIRRRSRDELYRAVLRRYVQLATEGGVAQAIFPEGGLSRDGKLGPPKLGLLSYIVDGFDPEGRDVVFVPVGLNYDRVLEDRILMAADLGKDGKARFKVSLWTAAKFVFGVLFGRLIGTVNRFGYACVSFGAPLSLKEHFEERGGDVADLGDRLARRIGAVVPALPTPLIATALLQADRPLALIDLKTEASTLMERLTDQGAHLHVPRSDFDYAVEVGLRMLVRRRIVTETGGLYAPADGEAETVRFYANSIAHLTGLKAPK
ncbi:MAG: 1-acyl-sn-glycerol-3-phosphate acyltransferase [Pseudomonadota bacterium]